MKPYKIPLADEIMMRFGAIMLLILVVIGSIWLGGHPTLRDHIGRPFWFAFFSLLPIVGGICGLVSIWRGNYFAPVGKVLFSATILLLVWMLLKFLSLPTPCVTGPCG